MTSAPSTSQHRRVRVHSDGFAIAGYVYPPEDWSPGHGPRPCLVILQGYSGLRHIYGLELPQVAARRGWWAMTFDHRGFGRSGGARGRVRPMEQVVDVLNVISYVSTIEGVDADKIAIHGSSFGAANGLWVTAMDDRVSAFVSSVGVHDCPRWMGAIHGAERWNEIVQATRAAARLRVTTGSEVWWPYSDIVPGDAQAKEVADRHRYADDPLFVDHYDSGSVEALLTFRPEQLAHLVAPRPTLIIYAENDQVVPPSEAHHLYEALSGPKQMLVLPGAYHYDAYHFVNPKLAEIAAQTSMDFLDSALSVHRA